MNQPNSPADAQLAEARDRVRSLFMERFNQTNFDDLTVRELKTKILSDSEGILRNNESDVIASVVSIIVWIIWT